MGQLGLDTKGMCFLCLEKISADDEDDGVTGFCLRSISRFLKIDQQSVLQKGLHHHHDNVFKRNTYDFCVTLCQTCYKMSSKLASMITELEKVKLMLDHQIITFHETLAKSQKQGSGSTLWECKSVEGIVKRQMEMKTELFDRLRQETEQKCRHFIESRSKKSPRVMLHRLHDKLTNKRKLVEKLQTNSELIPSVPVDAKKARIDLPAPLMITQIVSEENSERQMELKTEKSEDNEAHLIGMPVCLPMPSQNTLMDSSTEPLKLKSATNIAQKLRNAIISNKKSVEASHQQLILFDDTKNIKSGQAKEYRCHFCEISCSSADFIHLHLANAHPDKLFARKKNPKISDQAFKQICLELLLCEVRNTPRLQRHLLPTLYSCLYCKHVVEKAQRIKCHYIKCHYPIMSEKLEKLQNQNYTNHQGHEAVVKYETTSTSSMTLSINSIPPPQPSKEPVSLPLPPSSINQMSISNCPNSSIFLPVQQPCMQTQGTQIYSQVQPVQKVSAFTWIPPLPPFNTIYNTENRNNYNGSVVMENQPNVIHNYHQAHSDPGNHCQMTNYYYQNVNNNHHPQPLYSNYSEPQMYKSRVIPETGMDNFHPQNAPTEMEPSSNNFNQRQPDNTIKLPLTQHLEDGNIFSENKLDLGRFMESNKLFLEREVEMCTKTMPEDSLKIITHCPYCTETFIIKQSLRVHLCNQHYHILSEKLKKN